MISMDGRRRKSFRHRIGRSFLCLAFACLCFGPVRVLADPVADFYHGHKLEIMVGSAAGASYDAYARLLARHLTGFIPGNPTIIVTNQLGAGSLVATNMLYNDPNRDGSILGMVGQSLYFMQLVGQANIKYDAPKFNWIGRISNVIDLVVAWHGAKAKTLEDVKSIDTTVAVGAALSGSTMYVNFMNAMIGTRFLPIKGYDGPESFLAMERGEVDATGSANLYGLKAQHGDQLKNRQLDILVQMGLKKAPGLDAIPLFPDLARNETDRTILAALATTDEIGRSVLAPPGIPQDRLTALRRAFDATMASPKFLAEAERSQIAINPLSGEELQAMVSDSGHGLSPAMIAQIKTLVGRVD
jgi:tripartite-type tricarboxylate transporter receptor subunit TctC